MANVTSIRKSYDSPTKSMNPNSSQTVSIINPSIVVSTALSSLSQTSQPEKLLVPDATVDSGRKMSDRTQLQQNNASNSDLTMDKDVLEINAPNDPVDQTCFVCYRPFCKSKTCPYRKAVMRTPQVKLEITQRRQQFKKVNIDHFIRRSKSKKERWLQNAAARGKQTFPKQKHDTKSYNEEVNYDFN